MKSNKTSVLILGIIIGFSLLAFILLFNRSLSQKALPECREARGTNQVLTLSCEGITVYISTDIDLTPKRVWELFEKRTVGTFELRYKSALCEILGQTAMSKVKRVCIYPSHAPNEIIFKIEGKQ